MVFLMINIKKKMKFLVASIFIIFTINQYHMTIECSIQKAMKNELLKEEDGNKKGSECC